MRKSSAFGIQDKEEMIARKEKEKIKNYDVEVAENNGYYSLIDRGSIYADCRKKKIDKESVDALSLVIDSDKEAGHILEFELNDTKDASGNFEYFKSNSFADSINLTLRIYKRTIYYGISCQSEFNAAFGCGTFVLCNDTEKYNILENLFKAVNDLNVAGEAKVINMILENFMLMPDCLSKESIQKAFDYKMGNHKNKQWDKLYR